MTTPALLVGVDRAAFAVALAGRLRRAGADVGFARVEAFARAIGVVSPDTRAELYWTARVTLIGRRTDLPAFDAVFEAVFGEAVLGVDPHARRRSPAPPAGDDDEHVELPAGGDDDVSDGGLPWATLPAPVGAAEAAASELQLSERRPSDVEALADTPFADLDAAGLALLGRWLEAAAPAWPTRRSRRPDVHPAGRRVLLRASLARARRTGFEPVVLVRSRPRRVPRRVVMLCDVSRSMQPYTTAYLHLMRSATLHVDAEVFAFATALTRLTAVLAHRSAPVAVEQASERVTDRFGGTRIATNLRALLASRHGNAVRGALVVIASDGWDADPPEQLAAVMARLHRRAHRVIWLNPRAAAPGYRPEVGPMAAALPFCDRLLPGHTLAALGDVVTALTDA